MRTGRPEWFWRSHPSQAANGQWVGLQFPVPIRVRTVRLYNPPPSSSITTRVQATRVRLFADEAGQQELAAVTTGPISENGTDIPFGDMVARTVRVDFLDVTGTTRSMRVASLAEIEVIARGEDGGPACVPPSAAGPLASQVSGSQVLLVVAAAGAGDVSSCRRGGSAPAPQLAVLPVGGGQTSLAVNAPNGRYYVRVKATGACGTGPASNEVVVNVPGDMHGSGGAGGPHEQRGQRAGDDLLAGSRWSGELRHRGGIEPGRQQPARERAVGAGRAGVAGTRPVLGAGPLPQCLRRGVRPVGRHPRHRALTGGRPASPHRQAPPSASTRRCRLASSSLSVPTSATASPSRPCSARTNRE